MANRNPNPNRWNLTIAQQRPDSPLGSTGGGLICHHAIPYNRLRDFWNRAVRDNLDDFRGTFLRPFVQALRRYPVCPGDPGAAAGFTTAVAAVLDQVASGDITHDEGRLGPPKWGWVAQVYAWMPGNLFLGPLRPDKKKDPGWGSDPGEEFDTFASRCMAEGRYVAVRAGRQAIDTYLTLPAPPAPHAGWAAGPDVARGRACRAAGAAWPRSPGSPSRPRSTHKTGWGSGRSSDLVLLPLRAVRADAGGPAPGGPTAVGCHPLAGPDGAGCWRRSTTPHCARVASRRRAEEWHNRWGPHRKRLVSVGRPR